MAISAWSIKAIAQTTNSVGSIVSSPKPDGLISFNAGWQIPVDDQKALLALEDKKIKEVQAASPQATMGASDTPPTLAKKSWSDKVQDAWSKVRNFF
jgi:PAB1-binding protein PBP1